MPLTTDAYQPQNPDPIFDAYRAQFPYREEQARSDAEARKRKAQTAYDQGIYDLASQVKNTRSNTLSSLESRGVLQSGETQRRLAEITSREDEARARAAAGLLSQQQQADTDLQRQIAEMYADYQRQAEEAKAREFQNALQIWYAAQAGKPTPPPVKRNPIQPAPGGPPQPTLAEVAAAMRPAAVPAGQGGSAPTRQ